MSSTIWWLVLGVLIGWLIEWVIDWVYWRRRRQTSELGVQDGAELARLRDSLASARADNQRLQADLSAATASAQQRQVTIGELEAQLAKLRAEDKQPSLGTEAPRTLAVLSGDNGGDKASGFATVSQPKANGGQLLREREVARPVAQSRDPLIDINGIGPVYERKLFDAGVYTFEELAALTPEQVREIIALERWQEIDPAAWIAEARQLAQKKV